MASLQYEWEALQLEAIMCYLDHLNLSFTSLKRHQAIFEELLEKLGKLMTAHMTSFFDWLKVRCTIVKDNKLPIAKELLIKLCEAADKSFVKHKATLVKCVFLAIWGGFMQMCEYTANKKHCKNHNLCGDAITLNNLGFGISFWIDKASREDLVTKQEDLLEISTRICSRSF